MATKIDIVIEAVDNLSATVKKIEGNIEKMSRKAEKSMKKVQKSSKEMSDKTVNSVKKMNTAFGTLSTNMRRIGALVGSFYAVRSALVALAGVADDFKEFNEAMAYVNTIAQMTDENLASLTLQVEKLSIQLGKSAPEMAMGLYDIYSSGFEGAEAMKVLEVATIGAIAGLTTTAIAAKGLMAVMNAYNRKTGPDAVDIMDVMFKTVDKGVVTFPELASEIGSVVTIASQLGISFVEVGAAMSEMTLRGLSAAESATALEGLMRSIMKPADQTKEAIKKLNKENKGLNFEWGVAALRTKKLDGLLQDLFKAAKGNFEVIGKIIPSIRGLRSALALAANDGEGFIKMLEEQENRLGATKRAFEEANKSINRQLEETRSEWEKYKREVGEAMAEVELKLFKSLLTFAKWASKNKDAIISVAGVIKDLTLLFIAYKTAVLALIGLKKVVAFFYTLQAAIVFANQAMAVGVIRAVALRTALGLIPLNIIITVALTGFATVIYQIKQLGKAWEDEAASRHANIVAIEKARMGYEEKLINDVKILQDVRKIAEEQGDKETIARTENLERNVYALKKLYTAKLIKLNEDTGDRNVVTLNKQILEQKAIIKTGIEDLEKEGKLIGEWFTLAPMPKPEAGITVPEYAPFPTMEELLGPELDKAAKKIVDTIKKITKDISDFYTLLGDSANESIEAIEDQTKALEKAALKWGRYLEDIDIDLTRMSAKHKQVISDIQDDIADENRTFAESMDDRLRKFNDTMASMTTRHRDKTDDIQHQIDLELGMGIRADKEKLRGLYLMRDRENRDYKDKIAKDKEEKEREDAEDKARNTEALSDFEERLDREKTAFEQNTEDMKRELDRRVVNYATSQDDILTKTEETWADIGETIAKQLEKIVESIQDSALASTFANELNKIYALTAGLELPGTAVTRNIAAETEYIKGMGGYKATQEFFDKVNLGVYGTTNVPWAEGGVSIVINNPVLLDETYTEQLIQQIEVGLGDAQRLANKGAY